MIGCDCKAHYDFNELIREGYHRFFVFRGRHNDHLRTKLGLYVGRVEVPADWERIICGKDWLLWPQCISGNTYVNKNSPVNERPVNSFVGE